MRHCIVDKCTNADNIILCHRFPRNRALALKWQISLNLTDCPLDVLLSKSAVCCQHFDRTDYRNPLSNSLNATAIPKLQDINPRAMQAKNAPLVLPQNVHTEYADKPVSPVNSSDSIELVHREDDADDATEIDESLTSQNDEIYILPDELNTSDDLIDSIDGADFTMLDAAGCGMYTEYLGEKTLPTTDELSPYVDESKDSINSNQSHDHECRPDSTDSDVEVLVSEAVFETQWSETDHSAIVLNTGDTNNTESPLSPSISYQSDLSAKPNNVENSIVDLEFGHLSRLQLIDIIKSQSMRIEQLETKLNRYTLAQDELFTHLDLFRKSICDVNI